MNLEIKHYSLLTRDELYDILLLRSAVFVVEQNCVYQDLDNLDKDAFHILIKLDEQIVGTARILKPGIVYNEVAIGRVVSATNQRNLKLGHAIMTAAIHFITNELKENSIRLSAQTHLTNFYEKHGFKSTAKTYLEDGIPHTEMILTQ